MFGYRHGFHAGNFADVLKHVVLVMLVEALKRKEKPFCLLDTHAATGRYDLHSAEAQKNREFDGGIGRLWGRGDEPPEVAAYVAAVRTLNPDGKLRFYPGSPRLAHTLLRPQDRLIATELNRAEYAALKGEFAGDRQVAVHLQDAYQGLKAFLPPKERRGLVLIDPPYELKDEYERATAGLAGGWSRWPSGQFALWYPILSSGLRERFHRMVRATEMRKVLAVELELAEPEERSRLTGSGLLLVNPPFGLEERLAVVLPWLRAALTDAGGHAHRVEWLIPE